MAKDIKKGMLVRVLAPHNPLFLAVCTAARVSYARNEIDVRCEGEVQERTFTLDEVVAEQDVTELLIAQVEALKEDADRRYAAHKAEHRAERIAAYKETKAAEVGLTFVREEQEGWANRVEVVWGTPRQAGWGLQTLVTLSQRVDTGVPCVKVNWAAIGNVTPEMARAMGLALIAAADEGTMKREALEQELGI